MRPLVPRMHGKQAGHALDHHLAHVVLGLADQRDAALGVAIRSRERERLTHSAPARVLPAPRPPSISQVVQSPGGGDLMRMREELPVMQQPSTLPRLSKIASSSAAQSGADKRINFARKLATEFVDVSGHGIVIVRRPALLLPLPRACLRLVDRGKLAQRLRHHGERARVALALGQLEAGGLQPVLDLLDLPLGGAPHPRDQRGAAARAMAHADARRGAAGSARA